MIRGSVQIQGTWTHSCTVTFHDDVIQRIKQFMAISIQHCVCSTRYSLLLSGQRQYDLINLPDTCAYDSSEIKTHSDWSEGYYTKNTGMCIDIEIPNTLYSQNTGLCHLCVFINLVFSSSSFPGSGRNVLVYNETKVQALTYPESLIVAY